MDNNNCNESYNGRGEMIMQRKKQTMDGNHAAAHASYAFTDVAAIYPISPSTVMAEVTDEWAVKGRKNIFGQTVKVTEMQSEAGAAGAIHGALAAGALTTTFTASQGLLLMIPNLYKIAGEMLPGVFNVAARTIASHALSIFGDHSDIYACRQIGMAMLCSVNAQEIMDLTPVAHCTAIKGRIPFINFFDGFRTSNEMRKIEVWDYKDIEDLVDRDAIQNFRDHALNPNTPKQMGSAQNPDIFFQAREASNNNYAVLPDMVQAYMDKVNQKIGTSYKLFNYYGAEDATHILIAMGSVCETIEETVDYLNRIGQKVGVVKVHLYRPFHKEAFLASIPKTVKQISVLDRTKEPGAIGEPLYLDVIACLRDTEFQNIPVFSGRYGLSSKDTKPSQITAVFENREKKKFTIGIVDDVTNLSLSEGESIEIEDADLKSCKFWGLGADGTVGANKNSIKIIGDNTDMYVQAYFDYDSKKSGGVTVSHLRFGNNPIKSPYLIDKADFVACHNASYLLKYDMVQELKDGGSFLINCGCTFEEIDKKMPGHVKRYIVDHQIKLYLVDGITIAKEIGLGRRVNTILQSAFFKIAKIIPEEQAINYMKNAAKSTYEKKGEKIVQMNYEAIERGANEVRVLEIPLYWKDAKDSQMTQKVETENEELQDFVEKIQVPVNAQKGNQVPVSAFLKYVDGSFPSGSAAFERRGVAIDIPIWKPENCIQCARCSFVCPHGVIRTVALTKEEADKAPVGMKLLPMTGMPGYQFGIIISALDCQGCGSCANVCPGNKEGKALSMQDMQENSACQEFFDYAKELPEKKDVNEKFKPDTVKGSQFKKPLLEFSGACAGCGETPYAKLITQLFGDRMYIANATGCSSIWGHSVPSTPYTTNAKGQGPAWSNSLFEDAAEFGYGMKLAQVAMREALKEKVQMVMKETDREDIGNAAKEWLDSYYDGIQNGQATEKLVTTLSDYESATSNEILKGKEFLSKKSQWIFGGDGWAYDIGFGGLDHVLASGQDINVLVFDTEVYSNTGGQSSKSTQKGAIAKFAAGGKSTKKKDLAVMAMSYGYVYVAQIAMGADYNQCVKAITEAENYKGPSLIIAYSPCISHGIKAGMNAAQTEMASAVAAGYWHCFRFNPELALEGKPAFQLDSKSPSLDYESFLTGEVRYHSLIGSNPERAKELFLQAGEEAKAKYRYLNKLVKLYDMSEQE